MKIHMRLQTPIPTKTRTQARTLTWIQVTMQILVQARTRFRFETQDQPRFHIYISDSGSDLDSIAVLPRRFTGIFCCVCSFVGRGTGGNNKAGWMPELSQEHRLSSPSICKHNIVSKPAIWRVRYRVCCGTFSSAEQSSTFSYVQHSENL